MNFRNRIALALTVLVLISCGKSAKGGGSGPVEQKVDVKNCRDQQKEFFFKSDPSLSLNSSVDDLVGSAMRKDASFWEALPKCEN